jgi:hypothetical protein
VREIELEGVVAVTEAEFTGAESTYETQAVIVTVSPLEKTRGLLGEIMLTDKVDVTWKVPVATPVWAGLGESLSALMAYVPLTSVLAGLPLTVVQAGVTLG